MTDSNLLNIMNSIRGLIAIGVASITITTFFIRLDSRISDLDSKISNLESYVCESNNLVLFKLYQSQNILKKQAQYLNHSCDPAKYLLLHDE